MRNNGVRNSEPVMILVRNLLGFLPFIGFSEQVAQFTEVLALA